MQLKYNHLTNIPVFAKYTICTAFMQRDIYPIYNYAVAYRSNMILTAYMQRQLTHDAKTPLHI